MSKGLAIIIIILLLTGAQAATVHLEPGESIQAAINTAKPGDTIEVQSGTYHENLYVNKSIILRGLGGPVVDAGNSGSVIILVADGIILEGFNLTNSGHCGCGNAGIRVLADNSTIRENTAYKNRYGIYASGSGNRFYLNNLMENELSAYDSGSNIWEDSPGAIMILLGFKPKGNYYSDFDSPAEGCADSDSDGTCDSAYAIPGGGGTDRHPLVAMVLPGRRWL